MKNFQFNTKRFIEILNEIKYLQSQEQNSEIIEQLNSLKSETLNYLGLIQNEVQWRKKDHYLKLMNDFLQNVLDADEFAIKICKLFFETQKEATLISENEAQLKDFKVDHRTEGFCQLASDLMDYCDVVSDEKDDLENANTIYICKKELRDLILEEILPLMEEYP